MRNAGDIRQHHAEAVVERHRNAQPVVWRELHEFAGEKAVVQQIVVGQRGSLRRTGGPAGELNVDRVVELQVCRDLGEHVPPLSRCTVLHLGEGNRPAVERGTQLEHGPQVR